MFKDYNRHLIFSILIFDIAVLIFTWYATNKLIQENVTFLGVSANGSTKVAIIALLTAFNFYTIRSFFKYNSEKHKLISDVELKRIIQVWKEEKVNQLLSDVFDEFDSYPKKEYFTGTIGVCKNADGQQRITTIFIIICAFKVE